MALRIRSRAGGRPLRAGVVVCGLAAVALVASSCIYGGTWTAHTMPAVPVPNASDYPTKVDCPSSSDCLAVGPTNAAVWNGTTWSLVPGPASNIGTVVGVSCLTASSCLAASSTGVWRWNGSTWTALAWPGTATVSDLSCGAPSSCLIVGYASASPYGLVFERWNGTTLSGITPITTWTGSTHVSCTSSTWCLVTGAGRNGLAYLTWNGSSWSTGKPLPANLHSVLSDVDCASPTWCAGVIDGNFGIQSAQFDGTIWTASDYEPIDDLNGAFGWRAVACDAASSCYLVAEGGFIQSLTVPEMPWTSGGAALDVSCWGAGACRVVGRHIYDAGQDPSPIAAHLSGSSWTTDPYVLPTHVHTSMAAVSCPSPSFCMAAGASPPNGQSTVQTWNGSAWSSIEAPTGVDPSTGTTLVANDVACTSATFCALVETYSNPGAEPGDAFGYSQLSTWDGSSWSTSIPPNQRIWPTLKVSCATATSCLAVGEGVAWTWDGTSWTEADPPSNSQPGYVQGVSCASPTWCVSVSGELSLTALPSVSSAIHVWDGSTWTFSTAPAPAGQVAFLTGVSCSGSVCDAVGAVGTAGSTTMTPYILQETGGGPWVAQTMGGAAFSGRLTSVSCPSTTACVAVGTGTAGAPPVAVQPSEVLGSTGWSRGPDLPSPGPGPLAYASVSCRSQWCMTVGNLVSTPAVQPVSASYAYTS